MGTVSFPGVKRPEPGANHPPFLASRLKKVNSYISALPLCLHGKLWAKICLNLRESKSSVKSHVFKNSPFFLGNCKVYRRLIFKILIISSVILFLLLCFFPLFPPLLIPSPFSNFLFSFCTFECFLPKMKRRKYLAF